MAIGNNGKYDELSTLLIAETSRQLGNNKAYKMLFDKEVVPALMSKPYSIEEKQEYLCNMLEHAYENTAERLFLPMLEEMISNGYSNGSTNKRARKNAREWSELDRFFSVLKGEAGEPLILPSRGMKPIDKKVGQR